MDLASIFNFSFNIPQEKEIVLEKGQTVIIKVWSWGKLHNIKKAIFMDQDGSIKVTTL